LSLHACNQPDCTLRDCEEIELVIAPRQRDLGDFVVGRVLPVAQRRALGPFVFLDQMGPTSFQPGEGIGVRPHPHIGLSTVTYLWEGQVRHRDSLGSDLVIEPGAMNLMTAGRGIVHSERTPEAARNSGSRLYGAQLWMALPQEMQECEPAFHHYPMTDLPPIAGDGLTGRLVMGQAFGEVSPVVAAGAPLLADLTLERGAALTLPADYEERGLYVAEGTVEVAETEYRAPLLLVFNSGVSVAVKVLSEVRGLLLGGARLDGPRQMWWNFVHSDKERIERAKADWKEGRFPPVPGETEFIPLPE